jgi:hypothetical protein
VVRCTIKRAHISSIVCFDQWNCHILNGTIMRSEQLDIYSIIPLICYEIWISSHLYQLYSYQERKKSTSPPNLWGLEHITPQPMEIDFLPPELSKTGQITP